MDKKTIIFGLSGKFGSTGLLSNYPSSVFRTAGLNGIIQPYQVYIRENNQDGPYVERTKLTTDDQDTTQYSSRMTTTEYIKGHGDVSEAEVAASKQPGEIQTPSTSKAADETTEAKSAPPQTIKISEIQFKRKLDEHLDKQGDEQKKKKKKKHSFNLY